MQKISFLRLPCPSFRIPEHKGVKASSIPIASLTRSPCPYSKLCPLERAPCKVRKEQCPLLLG